MVSSNSKSARRREEKEVVLGAGGVKGLCHIGFLKAARELMVSTGKVTGVSAGSIAATFDRNGFTPDEMLDIFLTDEMRKPTSALANPLSFLNPLTYLAGGVVNIEAFIDRIVRRYGLKPQDDLRILAYNVLRREPTVFEGTDYNLTKAIAASCAVPFVMRPVLYFPERSREAGFITGKAKESMQRFGLLVDGGVHHINPGHFSEGPAIVASLGFATRLPSEWLSPVDLYMHLTEMTWSWLLNWYFAVPESDHVVINIAPRNVAGLTFGISDKKCREMADYAYRVSLAALSDEIEKGRLSTNKRRARARTR